MSYNLHDIFIFIFAQHMIQFVSYLDGVSLEDDFNGIFSGHDADLLLLRRRLRVLFLIDSDIVLASGDSEYCCLAGAGEFLVVDTIESLNLGSRDVALIWAAVHELMSFACVYTEDVRGEAGEEIEPGLDTQTLALDGLLGKLNAHVDAVVGDGSAG